MATEIVKNTDINAVPFFARFLEEQPSEPSDTPSTPTQPPFPFPLPYTFKFPSDWEDR
ncbi:microviridin/marinostatin family tricyclic proteinase inhibitor [Floridanema evergladense]|uniref:Microviridin/marinostatin family tricyclic proteinase inhibitor n=1 Tax=Floridaenema evergladense BLCC-F167 TaxID=3153639 RepID=A0ABV4WVZ9_9CYAN